MTASKCSLFEDMLRCGALRVVYIDNRRPRQCFVCFFVLRFTGFFRLDLS